MAWKSKYTKQLGGITNSILNREKFAYDMNSDALYNQYKDQYVSQGNVDMRNAVGDQATMTGGYGSSAAVAAGSKAYQANLSALNDKIPQLYSSAVNKYNNETSDMYNQFGLLNTLDQQEYQKYRDTISDSYNDSLYKLQQQQYAASQSSTAWEQNYKTNQFKYQREYDALRAKYGL